jgi:hypothetical protein
MLRRLHVSDLDATAAAPAPHTSYLVTALERATRHGRCSSGYTSSRRMFAITSA